MDPLENLKFFKAKVNCHINQIIARKLYISIGNYNLIRINNIWEKDKYCRGLHPLSLFIEGKKILRDTQCILHISRLLDIDIIFLRAFNTGLKNVEADSFNKLLWVQKAKDNKKSIIKKYFVFGRIIRAKIDRKKI